MTTTMAAPTARPVTPARRRSPVDRPSGSPQLARPASTPCGRLVLVVPPQTGAEPELGSITICPVAFDGAQVPDGTKVAVKWCVPTASAAPSLEPQQPTLSTSTPLLGTACRSTTTPSIANSIVPCGVPASEATEIATGTQVPYGAVGTLLIVVTVAAA